MNRVPVPPWRGLLQRKTEEHFRRFHADAGNFTRRGFLSAAAGVAGLAAASEFALCPVALADPKTVEPNPIPGGVPHSASMFTTIRCPMTRHYP